MIKRPLKYFAIELLLETSVFGSHLKYLLNFSIILFVAFVIQVNIAEVFSGFLQAE